MCAPYTQRKLPSPAPTLSSTLRSGFRKVKTLSLKQGLSVDMGQRGEVKKGKATKKNRTFTQCQTLPLYVLWLLLL